ncbi:MAG: hypothetical protein WBF33_31580, partial [Candidatus Nitrosopolaris sp.]
IRRASITKDRVLKNQINKIVENMQSDIKYGDFNKNKPYPLKYKCLSNIYTVRVTDYYRLIYTIAGTHQKKYYVLLDFLNHDEYNKLFDYKKS